jgi:hypothetical protein
MLGGATVRFEDEQRTTDHRMGSRRPGQMLVHLSLCLQSGRLLLAGAEDSDPGSRLCSLRRKPISQRKPSTAHRVGSLGKIGDPIEATAVEQHVDKPVGLLGEAAGAAD